MKPLLHLREPRENRAGVISNAVLRPQMPASQDSRVLKQRFLQCFAVRSTNTETLRQVIRELLNLGMVRKTLVRWAIEAGYNCASVRSLLSRIFCALGLRERAKGAGRKPSPEAQELLAYAQARYGDRYLRVLHAAYRAASARARGTGVPEAWSEDANCGAAISASRWASTKELSKVRVNRSLFCASDQLQLDDSAKCDSEFAKLGFPLASRPAGVAKVYKPANRNCRQRETSTPPISLFRHAKLRLGTNFALRNARPTAVSLPPRSISNVCMLCAQATPKQSRVLAR
jgi:hypothetical protein